MADFQYHGSYPDDQPACKWRRVCRISVDIAAAFYNGALERQQKPMIEEGFWNYLNKCFTVVQQTFSSVIAIYKHDYKWWLIEADKVEFLKAWEKSRAGLKDRSVRPYDHFDYRWEE
jgi:hypothetical protein